MVGLFKGQCLDLRELYSTLFQKVLKLSPPGHVVDMIVKNNQSISNVWNRSHIIDKAFLIKVG